MKEIRETKHAEVQVSSEDGWPFRLAFAAGTLAFFLNRAVSSPINDVLVVAATFVIVIAVSVLTLRSSEKDRTIKSLLLATERRDSDNACPTCGRALQNVEDRRA